MVDAGTTPAANSVQGVLGGGTTARAAEVDNAVVIAAYSYTSTAGATSGTFYLQDQGPNSSTGIEVYVASTDAVTFPSVGDIVTVKGYLSIYSASVQIASSKSPATPLVVTNTGSGGMSSSGAYSPAGSPTMVSSTTGYAATVTNAHAEQLGTAIQFAGPLTVSSMTAPGLIHTKADGGTVSEGFEITGGVYVYDANTYFNCMKGQASDGGTLYPTLTTGIRGVWSRYQDGTTGKVYPVLIPMDCSDFAP
jgi:predicted extracellular nuclease